MFASRFKVVAFISLFFALASCGGNSNSAPLATVPGVEISRYLGTWYEIVSIPSFFQRGCTNTTARYDLNQDGSIRVENNCVARGKNKNIIGSARAIDRTNAKLEVSFRILGLFNTRGDYWVLGLGPIRPDGLYSWAVVGEKGRKFGWILSRTPQLGAQEEAKAAEILRQSGYDLSRFQRTPQQVR